ncbi:aldo/keto reductase [Paenibacillus alkalitolerans]|uniref:aldo/keto reductase n=1 Tax=Paenibacillus alkalitolerans TaxID=2799335 RepID=UPI0018F2C051|nr:aldo/keto reductase [Paenibacillus alkalitolerans]
MNLDGRIIPYGLGCAYLGRSDSTGESLKNSIATLEFAYDSGFRYFDTSANYGESETVLGRFAASVERETVFVATKSQWLPAELHPRAAAERMKESFFRSLERLNTDYFDLYQFHDVTTLEHLVGEGGALEKLLDFKRQGLVRYVGLATRPLALLAEACRMGVFDTILTFSDYTPLETPAKSVIKLAARLGVGVINASPLAGNLIRGTEPRDIRLPDGDIRLSRLPKAIAFYDFCRSRYVSELALAFQFPLFNSRIDITLTGPASVEQVRSTLTCLNQRIDPAVWNDWKELKIRSGGGRSGI